MPSERVEAARNGGRGGWDHNLHYHPLVLQSVPAACGRALDVGCGEGLLTARLASHCAEVVAIDLDPAMLPNFWAGDGALNMSFVQGNVLTYPFALESFEFIAAVAALHHLPLEAGLTRLRDLLAPGGVLAVVGLYRPCTPMDYALAAAARPVSWLLRTIRGQAQTRASLRRPEQSLADIRRACHALLPGAALQRRFFFRYSLIWRKPDPGYSSFHQGVAVAVRNAEGLRK